MIAEAETIIKEEVQPIGQVWSRCPVIHREVTKKHKQKIKDKNGKIRTVVKTNRYLTSSKQEEWSYKVLTRDADTVLIYEQGGGRIALNLTDGVGSREMEVSWPHHKYDSLPKLVQDFVRDSR